MNLNILNFLKKPGLPDAFGLKVRFVYGEVEDFDVVSYQVLPTGVIELSLADDTFCVIPLASVGKINFDKRFTKVVEERRKVEAEKLKASNGQI